MAKLGIMPLQFYRPRGPVQPWTDAMTATTYSDATGILSMDIGTDAVLTAIYRSTDDMLDRITLTLKTATPNVLVIARINRVLDGLNAPRLEAYFRMGGALVWRFPGTPVAVASYLEIEGSVASNGSWAWSVGTRIAGPAPVVAPAPIVAPAAPVQTPTPAPAAPRQAPIITAENLNEVFPPVAPAPIAPAPAPVAPLKVTPNRADTDSKGLFEYPSRSTTNVIVMSAINRKIMAATWHKHEQRGRATLALVGPAGTGKTDALDDLAAEKGIGIFTFDAMGASSFSDWTGRMDLNSADGALQTSYIYSSFIEAIRIDGQYAGQKRIVRVDEANRAESSAALNALMPILTRGALYIPETGHTIRIDPAVLFAFTLNRGSEFAGTVTLDEALADRMQAWMKLDYLPLEDEVKLIVDRVGLTDEAARPMVMAARQVREIAARGEITSGISHRRVLEAAAFVKDGILSASEAAEACWANKYSDQGGSEGEAGIVLMAIKSVLK